MKPEHPIDIFVSYSRKDAYWRDRLMPQLLALERQGRFSVFCDSRFKAGQSTRNAITQAVRSARVFLLLVSPHSLASEFIERHEVSVARARASRGELQLVPLLVESAPWREVQWLSDRQFAGVESGTTAPESLSAIEERSETACDEVLSRVAEQLAEAIPSAVRPATWNPLDFQLANLCDREYQIECYRKWDREKHSNLYLPQIWIVFGEEKEELAGLCSRVFHEEVCAHLPQGSEPCPTLKTVEWPGATAPAQSLGERLLATMIPERVLLHGHSWADEGGRHLAEAIWKKRDCYSALGFQHEAWTADEADDVLRIFKDYIPMLEAAAGHLSALAEERGTAPPLLCFFLCVTFERTRQWMWWPRWPAHIDWWPLMLSRVAKIRRGARRLCGNKPPEKAAASFCYVGSLPELRSVGKDQVRAWLRAHCDGIAEEHFKYCERIFAGRRHLPMLKLKKELVQARVELRQS